MHKCTCITSLKFCIKDSLVIFLIDVETVGQTGQKSFYNDIIHRQPRLQAPEQKNIDSIRDEGTAE